MRGLHRGRLSAARSRVRDHARALAVVAVMGAAALPAYAQSLPRSGVAPSGGGAGSGVVPGITLGRVLTPAQALAASLPPPVKLPEPPPQAPGLFGPAGAIAPQPSTGPRDLEGSWRRDKPMGETLSRIQTDMYGEPVPFAMPGAVLLRRRVLSMTAGKPVSNASATCRPPGVVWQHDIGFPFNIYQTRNYVEFVFSEYHGRWSIQLGPASARPPADPQYMGYSLGHWDGDTLVVDTDGFKQGAWLDFDGTPISRNARLVTRLRKVDDGDGQVYLEIRTTVIDGTYYASPWSVVRRYRRSSPAIHEYNCEEQIGDPSVRDDGLLAEQETK